MKYLTAHDYDTPVLTKEAMFRYCKAINKKPSEIKLHEAIEHKLHVDLIETIEEAYDEYDYSVPDELRHKLDDLQIQLDDLLHEYVGGYYEGKLVDCTELDKEFNNLYNL